MKKWLGITFIALQLNQFLYAGWNDYVPRIISLNDLKKSSAASLDKATQTISTITPAQWGCIGVGGLALSAYVVKKKIDARKESQQALVQSENQQTDDDEDCSICQQPMKKDQLIATLHKDVQPAHSIHEECIIDWYEKSPHKNCPLCRQRISMSECFGSLSTKHNVRMYAGEFTYGFLKPTFLLGYGAVCFAMHKNSSVNVPSAVTNLVGKGVEHVQTKAINTIYSLNGDFHYKERRELFKDETGLKAARWIGYGTGAALGGYAVWKYINLPKS